MKDEEELSLLLCGGCGVELRWILGMIIFLYFGELSEIG